MLRARGSEPALAPLRERAHIGRDVDRARPGRARTTRRGSLDQRYLEALARGDAEGAAAVVDDARRRNLTVEQIYLHMLAPALVEIGARWKARRLSVADEHLASEITLAEMERLRERFPPPTSSTSLRAARPPSSRCQ